MTSSDCTLFSTTLAASCTSSAILSTSCAAWAITSRTIERRSMNARRNMGDVRVVVSRVRSAERRVLKSNLICAGVGTSSITAEAPSWAVVTTELVARSAA
ncbi:hypothetical protein CPB83DRAFT_863178 [Crepidotus variabilis]|uniref:Uncharacterized protein n=1 Tax=Crepidotus variabilis TaxID=179855 RepID=A0A9P6E692_9AGAR|nr:hypothetical protein CPB83DRAFT_863178 [Crepidotus variabilis]